MTQLRVSCFSLSLDGFGAGLKQSLADPLGICGMELHEWLFPTAAFQRMVDGKAEGTTGVDNDFAARAMENIGAWIMGRNMFGPVRGKWPNDEWRGWWGDNPPFHTPVFVVTHHPRASIEMEGGTAFHFVTDGIHAALERAKAAAGGLDVRLGGGVATVREYLRAGLVDELHLAYVPVLLDAGENLLAGLNLRSLGYRCVERAATDHVTHIVLRRA